MNQLETGSFLGFALALSQLWGMTISLQLAVARCTARVLINGTAAADYSEVINLHRMMQLEGETVLAAGLLALARSLNPTGAMRDVSAHAPHPLAKPHA